MFDAIVLAGGRARRLDGADKPALEVGGVSLLERALAAAGAAERTIVVGPRRATTRPVIWCREQPPGGGPVAAIDAAIAHVRAETVLVLATDQPEIAPAVPVLLAALGDAGDCALLVDPDGRANYLAALWRTAALRRRLAEVGEPSGASARALYAGADMMVVPDRAGWGQDCDTWSDLMAARRRSGRAPD